MALELQLDYRLRWMDFDRYDHIKPSALLDIFQDVATVQSATMGLGREDMTANGWFWVIVRMKLEIVKQPHRLQLVTARTWPHTRSHVSFMRDFQLLDEAGEVLAKATSEWVVLDIATRNIVRMDTVYDGPRTFCEDRAFEGRIRKLPDFEGDPSRSCVIVPAFCDIDQNGHVNNAKYLDFALNALNPGPDDEVRMFQIDYRHEVLPGAPLHMQVRTEEGTSRCKGVIEDGEVAFVCAMEFKDRG